LRHPELLPTSGRSLHSATRPCRIRTCVACLIYIDLPPWFNQSWSILPELSRRKPLNCQNSYSYISG
jgi:hypothetical protein